MIMSKKSPISKHQKLMYVLIAVVVVAIGAYFLSGHSGGVGAGQAIALGGVAGSVPTVVTYTVTSCTPSATGIAVIESDGRTMKPYTNGCAAGSTVVYTCSVDGRSYKRTTTACAAGLLCSAGQCVAPRCQGAVPANAVLCAGDGTGLVANANRLLVNSCTNGAKCEYTCTAGYSLLLNRVTGVLECQRPAPAVLSCQNVPVNAVACAGDDTGLTIQSARTAVLVAGVNACTARKCEYTCNAGSVLQNGQCVVSFCRRLPGFNGAQTEQGTFWNTCVDSVLTNYYCNAGNNMGQSSSQCYQGLGCNADGVSCCRVWNGIPVAQAQGVTGPVSSGNVTAINLRCEGNVFINESRTTCNDELVTVRSDCSLMHERCDVAARGGCYWSPN